MNKVYYLATCDTCKRILNDWNLPQAFIKQEVKNETITAKQLEEMRERSGSYEALFSKRAKRYKERNLKDEILSEKDYKELILEHYTFLKRPVLLIGDQIFIGNSKKSIEAAKQALQTL